MLDVDSIKFVCEKQWSFFNNGNTLSYQFRYKQLIALRAALKENSDRLVKALQADLGRPSFEAYFELDVINEVKLALKKLKSWMKPVKAIPSISQFPGQVWQEPQAIGSVLIISPWNYPVELTFRPLVGAIAAGNCIIIKPSEHSTHVSALIAEIIASIYPPEYITVIQGDARQSEILLEQNFAHIFFTGSTSVGRIIAAKAGAKLIPCTLELGGKSPVIVCADANLQLAAKRILWGKLINAGQTCIAPDYVLVDTSVEEQLISCFKATLNQFFADGVKLGYNIGKIINHSHWQRLKNLLVGCEVVAGGGYDEDRLLIEPSLVKIHDATETIMQEEIFGPILPIISFNDLSDVIIELKTKERPLALYLFTNSPEIESKVLKETLSGGMSINDTVLHMTNSRTPFGGIGTSGNGSYHGYHTFKIFSHFKTVLKQRKFDFPWRYLPYKQWQRKLLKLIIS